MRVTSAGKNSGIDVRHADRAIVALASLRDAEIHSMVHTEDALEACISHSTALARTKAEMDEHRPLGGLNTDFQPEKRLHEDLLAAAAIEAHVLAGDFQVHIDGAEVVVTWQATEVVAISNPSVIRGRARVYVDEILRQLLRLLSGP